jgi:DNA-binding response OmpR family regulator
MVRALIIDDDQLIHYAVSKALHPYCPEVKAVSSRDEALHEINSCFYPLCFLDIALPGSHGLPLLKEIRAKSPDTKVVIMTGESVDEETKKEIDECSYCFLTKPFEISELKAIAKQALGKTEEEHYEENRRSARSILKKTVHYTITVLEFGKPISLTLKGDLIDVSTVGLGLRTCYPLEPGHLLFFSNGLEESEHRTGIVKWSLLTDDSFMYRVGVEFVTM